LKEPEEDLYTLSDGKPFHDDGFDSNISARIRDITSSYDIFKERTMTFLVSV